MWSQPVASVSRMHQRGLDGAGNYPRDRIQSLCLFSGRDKDNNDLIFYFNFGVITLLPSVFAVLTGLPVGHFPCNRHKAALRHTQIMMVSLILFLDDERFQFLRFLEPGKALLLLMEE